MVIRLATTAVPVVLAVLAASNAFASDERPADRKALIARSKVWHPTDIASMNLRTGPAAPDAFTAGATVTCDYVEKDLTGVSPKFACRRPDGDVVKVKYGGATGESGEVYGEVAASRLLWALGFGADRMYPVRVVCRGCPREVGGVERTGGERIIDPATIERKVGRELSDKWDWNELESTHEATGGASTAERDGLKLLAVMLQHGDNKPENQRIVCLDAPAEQKQPCAEPLMMIHDLGITFGRASSRNRQPRSSVNLREWSGLPVWKDREKCVGNLPGSWSGTLKDPVISEDGRTFLADLLTQLSDDQLRDMFDAARVTLRPRAPESGRSDFPTVEEWVNAFKQKRAEIVDHRCAA